MLSSKWYSNCWTSTLLRLPLRNSLQTVNKLSSEIIWSKVLLWKIICLLSPPPEENSTPQIILQTVEFYKILHIYLNGFPKIEKYSLGCEIQQTALSFLKLILSANNSRVDREEILKSASNNLDQLKILIRIAWELDALSQKRYCHLVASLQPIGKMLGGWLKQTQKWETSAERPPMLELWLSGFQLWLTFKLPSWLKLAFKTLPS